MFGADEKMELYIFLDASIFVSLKTDKNDKIGNLFAKNVDFVCLLSILFVIKYLFTILVKITPET